MNIVGIGLNLRVQWRTGWKAIAAWVLGLLALVLLTTTSVKSLYGTPDKLSTYSESLASPALRMLNGDVAGVDTLGGVMVNELGMVVALVIPMLAIALTVRGTRREEETGRLELLLAARMGRQAPLVAAVLLALGALAVLGALTTLSFLAAGVESLGSIVYGLDLVAFGAVFIGLTAVLAQLFAHQRSVWAVGLAIALTCYVVRGIGAVDRTWLVWLSPHGWYDQAAPFGDPHALPFVLCAVTTAALLALALRLSAGRDVGGSLVAARTGPRRASSGLRSPFGLALRDHRSLTIGWALLGAALMGIYGSLSQTVLDAFESNPDLAEFIGSGEAEIIDPLAAMFVLMLSMLVAGYVLQALGSLRAEEVSGRLELQLSESRSRPAWLAPHVAVVAGGALTIAGVGALALALSTASVLSDSDWIAKIVTAAAIHLPVTLLFAGVSVALFGWLPRAQPAAWALFAVSAVLAYMGPGLDLPTWLVEWSPFGLVGNVPAEDVDVTGSIAAAVGGLVLLALGVVGFTRRDIPHR